MPRASVPAPTPTAPAMMAAVQAPGAAPAAVSAPMPMPGLPPGVPPPRMAGASDERVSTGLANNFNGRVRAVWYLPRLYPIGQRKRQGAQGNLDAYSLTRLIEIEADDRTLGDGGIVREFLRVDDLSQWVPSRTMPQWGGSDYIYTPAGSVSGRPATLDDFMALHNGAGFPSLNNDGTPKFKKTKEGQPVYDTNGQQVPELALLAPEDWWGWFVIPGKENNRDAFKTGTKDAQFKDELERLGYPKRVAPHITGHDMRTWLVGVYGTWVRVPFTFSGGQAPAGTDKVDTLCLAQILDLGPISGSQGAAMVTVPSGVPAAVQAPVAAPAPVPVAMAAPVPSPAPVVAPMPPAAATFQMAPAPVPAPVVAAPAPVPVSAPAQPPNAARNDPAAVSAAANEIITALTRGLVPDLVPAHLVSAATAIAARRQFNKQDIGSIVMETVSARGLAGEMALRFLNDNAADGWCLADERTFGYVPEQGLFVPLPA